MGCPACETANAKKGGNLKSRLNSCKEERILRLSCRQRSAALGCCGFGMMPAMCMHPGSLRHGTMQFSSAVCMSRHAVGSVLSRLMSEEGRKSTLA